MFHPFGYIGPDGRPEFYPVPPNHLCRDNSSCMGTMKDVIIVGAGPAGCAAAYDLAAAGLSVQLLDKKQFPRVKACAGALTMKTIRALRYSVLPVIRHICHDFQVGLRLERSNLFPSR